MALIGTSSKLPLTSRPMDADTTINAIRQHYYELEQAVDDVLVLSEDQRQIAQVGDDLDVFQEAFHQVNCTNYWNSMSHTN
jgi:hypothetical protein